MQAIPSTIPGPAKRVRTAAADFNANRQAMLRAFEAKVRDDLHGEELLVEAVTTAIAMSQIVALHRG